MSTALDSTLGLNLLTPKSLLRLQADLPKDLYEPLNWCVGSFAEVSRPILAAKDWSGVARALDASLAKFAAVRMRFLELLFNLAGGDGRRLLLALRDLSLEIADEFPEVAEAVVGKRASQYLAQTIALAVAAIDRIDQAMKTSSGFGWNLHAEEEATLRTWALRADALLIVCSTGISEPESVADERLLAELCHRAYETMAHYFSSLERALSDRTDAGRGSTEDMLAEFQIDVPQWVHALESDDWTR